MGRRPPHSPHFPVHGCRIATLCPSPVPVPPTVPDTVTAMVGCNWPGEIRTPGLLFVSVFRPSTERIRSAGCDQSPARQPARLADDKPVTLLPADQRAL